MLFKRTKHILLLSVALLKINSCYGITYFDRCINNGDIAITFDDGPSLSYTSKILDILDRENIKATFFVNGQNCCSVANDPVAQALIKREFESGHVIGSHTYSHPPGIVGLTDEELTYQLTELNNVLYKLIGVKPAFFRPPLGEYSPENLKVIEKCGFKANILWNLDSEDWDPNYYSLQQYKDSLNGKDPKNYSWIALNHDIQQNTAEKNLVLIIDYVRSLGYHFVTMQECTGIYPYQDGGSPMPSPEPLPVTTINNSQTTNIIQQNPSGTMTIATVTNSVTNNGSQPTNGINNSTIVPGNGTLSNVNSANSIKISLIANIILILISILFIN